MNKLLIVGSNTIHTYNYIDLIKGYFDDILLLTNARRSGFAVKSVELDFSMRPLSMFRTISKIKRVADEYNPSMVHIHQANSYAFLTILALKKRKMPIVLTAWGSDVLVVPEINVFYKYMVQYALNNADVITSDSLYMATKIRQLCTEPPNIFMVTYGINQSGLTHEKKNLVFSNRLHKSQYNIDKIIIAFKRFVAVNSDWKLVIAGVGTDDETRKLVELSKELGIEQHVEFRGWLGAQENLSLYAQSKIYVSIPDSDATSISLLEAISNNCICFVSNLPANTEHILDRINGFIEDDLCNIDFNKYMEIDSRLMMEVNNARSRLYGKEYSKKTFYDIFDGVITNRENI